MSATSDMELDLLQRRAWGCGCYVNRHLKSDIAFGDLYLMDKRTKRNPKPPTLAKYATVAQIEQALTVVEAERFKQKSFAGS